MTERELMNSCREIIGEPADDDWKIQPTQHADFYDMEAPGLSRVLREARIRGRAREYKLADHDAEAEQARFKKLAIWASRCIFLIVVVGALLMVLATLSPNGGYNEEQPESASRSKAAEIFELGAIDRPISAVLAVLGLIIGGIATYLLTKLNDAKSLERWYKKRARAEKFRLEYFEKVAAPSDQCSDRKLNLLKLEYIRRYLVDSQEAYFGKRGREHLAGSRRNGSLSALAASIASVATLLAGLLAAVLSPAWASLSALGIVSTGFIALRKSNDEIEQHRRNAEQFEQTRESLAELSMNKLDSVRRMLAAGTGQNAEPLTVFVHAVEKILMEEHTHWLEGHSARAQAIADLSRELERLKGTSEDADSRHSKHPSDY